MLQSGHSDMAAPVPRNNRKTAIWVAGFVAFMLALTFANDSDYDKIQENDLINFTDLTAFAPEKQLHLELLHDDGSKDVIAVNHTYNAQQIEWFKAGGALNLIRKSLN